MKTGIELQLALEDVGINALWIPNTGMIFMPSFYGCRCTVSGWYDVYPRNVAERVLVAAEDDDFRLAEYLYGRETGQRYEVH